MLVWIEFAGSVERKGDVCVFLSYVKRFGRKAPNLPFNVCSLEEELGFLYVPKELEWLIPGLFTFKAHDDDRGAFTRNNKFVNLTFVLRS